MFGQIINDEKFKIAQDRLNLWANSALILEEQYFMRDNEVSNRDFNFLKLIGQNVYSLNLFNSLIISSIENRIREIKENNNINKEQIKELESLALYLRFYNSLIASKIKFFFFREKPIRNTNNPFVDLDFEILKTGNELLNALNKQQLTCLDEITSISARYFFYQNLLYAFIYNSEQDKGLFLAFDYDINVFIDIKSIILDKINVIKSEKELREFGSSLICWLAEYYAVLDDDNKRFKIENIEKPSCYNNLFNRLMDKPTLIEPFTYHFSNIIWKIDGMVHDDDEYIDFSLKKKQENIVIKLLVKFANKYFKEAEKMYKLNLVDFKKFFQIESNFLSEIYPIIFHQEPVGVIRDKFDAIQTVINNKKDNINKEVKQSDCSLLDTFEKVRSLGEIGFKMESLIETLAPSELIFFLRAYSEIILNDLVRDPQTEFIGFYKSGVFLGHIVNLIKMETINDYVFKNVWLFKTKPYVATHPIHIDKPKNDLGTIIVFDECFKTGFTYSLYESYLARNLYNSHISIATCPIFDFIYYKRLDFNNQPDIHSLISLNNNLLPINIDELNTIEYILNKNKFNLMVPTKKINIEKLIEKLSYEKKINNTQCNCIDLTFLLSNTDIIFSICYNFSEQITKLVKDSNRTICLLSGSSDGAVLSLITSFILKSVFDLNIHFGINNKNNDELLIGLDLSLITGFSLAYNYAIKRYGRFEYRRINEYLSDFDLICTIMSSGKINDNLFSLFKSDKSL